MDKEKLNILWKINDLVKCGIKIRYLSTNNSIKELEIEYSIGKYMYDEEMRIKEVIDAVNNNHPNVNNIIIEYINEGKGHLDKLKYSSIWDKINKLVSM